MLWIAVSILSRIFFAGCNVLDSHFRQAVFKNAYAQNFCGAIYYLIAVPVLFLLVRPQMPPPGDWGWLIISGVTLNLYLVPYYEAMKWGDSSSVASLFNLSRIFTPILAYFIIGEQLSLPGYIGFGVILLGSILLSYDRAALKFSFKPIFFMSLSGLLLALSTVTSKHVFAHMPWLDAVTYMMAFTPVAFLPYLVPSLRPGINEGMKKFPSYVVPMALTTLFSILGNLLFYFAVSLTFASYASMIGLFQPFIVMGLSFAAYKLGWLSARESFHPRDITQKIIAFIIMSAGLMITLWPKT